eukprot:6190373-Pleurochrysis_carterae.AAC.3
MGITKSKSWPGPVGKQRCSAELKSVVFAAASITAEFRRDCVHAIKELKIEVVGAPYEAQGQMARAFADGSVDAIMTTFGLKVGSTCMGP